MCKGGFHETRGKGARKSRKHSSLERMRQAPTGRWKEEKGEEGKGNNTVSTTLPAFPPCAAIVWDRQRLEEVSSTFSSQA